MVYMALPHWLSTSMVNFDQNREKSKCRDWVVTTQSLIFSQFWVIPHHRQSTDRPPPFQKPCDHFVEKKKLVQFFFLGLEIIYKNGY